MNIGGIKVGLPSFNPMKENKNKPLANLNEPIQDVFVSSKKYATKPTENEAVNIVANMKNAEGKPRFSEKEVNDFKISCATKVLDFETVNAFKDNTDFTMSNMKAVYRMGKDLKDDKFNEKVLSAISKLPKGVKPDDFEQNEYEPQKEFSLKCSYKGKFKFDAKSTDIIAKTEYDLSDVKVDIKKDIDFRNNTVTTVKKSYDYEKMKYNILEQTVVKNDKDGNLLRKEILKPSEVKGVYDVTYVYPNGETKQASKATIDKKTGIVSIKRDFKSNNGTRTQFLYENDPQGNKIVDYKITDKNGKILMGLHHNREASINFEEKLKGNKKDLVNLLKKVSGEELFETVQNIGKMDSTNSIYQAGFSPVSKEISIMDNLFVFLHELGHAKDAQNQKTYREKLLGENKMFSGNKDIKEAYLKERETFNKFHSEEERDHVSYFTQAKGHYGGEFGGLSEVVAETNAITNSFADESSGLSIRSQYLQQYFPETIAKIQDAMNWKDDLDAIEYYGT